MLDNLNNRTNVQLVFIVLVVWLIGLIVNTGGVLIMWSLLSWGEVVTSEPTWPASLALGTVLFWLRTMFNSVDKKK
jgi:hypothetical protein